MLAALPLGKRPIKMPNFKSLRFFFAPLAGARERIYITMHSVESRFVMESSNTLLGGVDVCTFDPGHFTGWGRDGVKPGKHTHLALHTHAHARTHTLSLSLSLSHTHTHTHTPKKTKNKKQPLSSPFRRYSRLGCMLFSQRYEPGALELKNL